MRTPDEIKKLLANYKGCIYDGDALMADALAYIQQLEQINADFAERTAQLEAENRGWVAKCHLMEERAGKDINVPSWANWTTVNNPPKTGGRYLIMFENGNVSDAEYDPEIDNECPFGEWHGEYRDEGFSGSIWRAYPEVTHWMPLPEPPKEG